MKKVYFIATVSVVISLIGVLYFTENAQNFSQQTESSDVITQQTDQFAQLSELSQVSVEVPTLVDTMQEMDEQFDLSQEELMESVWHVNADNSSSAAEYAQRLGAEEFQTVDFNQTMYLDIGEGDQVSIELPSGESLVVNVTAESLNKNGDYTWRGKVNQDDQDFPVVMTQGEFGTYGSIATESGTYTITTTSQGVGVIYKNPPLPEDNSDDFLDVPIHS